MQAFVRDIDQLVSDLRARPCVSRTCVVCFRECCCNELAQNPMHDECALLDSYAWTD